jgi:mRNA-decapping enzyme subunit 2
MLWMTLIQCVLVKGWKSSAAWGFPKGKINQQESERDCAVREVLEETGFDCDSLLEADSSDFMELTMREQKIRLYIVPGLDETTHFETMTRKEISVRIDVIVSISLVLC